MADALERSNAVDKGPLIQATSGDAPEGHDGVATGHRTIVRDETVLNNRPSLAPVGTLHSSGGSDAGAFVRVGMKVLNSDGEVIGTVALIEADKFKLAPHGLEGDFFIPLNQIDGVDDERVILAERDDTYLGLGGPP